MHFHEQIAGKYKYFWLSSKIILQTTEKKSALGCTLSLKVGFPVSVSTHVSLKPSNPYQEHVNNNIIPEAVS